MTKTDQDKYRIIAAATTLLVAVVAIVLLFLLRLHFNPSDKPSWPPENESEILAVEEFYEVLPQPIVPGGSNAPDDGSAPPPPDAQDMVNAGTPAPQVTPVNTSTRPSPMQQQKQKPQQSTGPSQAEIEAQRAKERREKEATTNANNAVQIFGNTASSQGSGTGDTGDGQGASNSEGRYRGASGSGNADGRTVTIPKFKVPGGAGGNMVVIVYFDRNGNPLSSPAPRVVSKSGVCVDSEVNAICLTKAKQSHLTPKADGPERQAVTITINVK